MAGTKAVHDEKKSKKAGSDPGLFLFGAALTHFTDVIIREGG
jgi:hypothetical protein